MCSSADLVAIRFLTHGPNNNREPGELALVDPARARALLAGGYAELAAPGEGGLECAMVEASENAMKPRARAKKRVTS